MEKTIKSSLVYDGKIIKVYKDDVLMNNSIKTVREVVKHVKGVCIAVRDDDGYFYVVKQYRYALKKEMIEFCAGKAEESEDLFETVKREVKEELGFDLKNVIKLGVIIPTCGYCDEELSLFYGEVLNKGEQHFDDDEYLNVEKYKIEDIEKMIDDGTIDDGKTIATMYYLKRKGLNV